MSSSTKRKRGVDKDCENAAPKVDAGSALAIKPNRAPKHKTHPLAMEPNRVHIPLDSDRQVADDDIYFERTYLLCGANGTFYDISVTGKSLTIIWGKVGTPGTKLEMTLCSEVACANTLEEKVKEKLRKGYVSAAPPAVLDRGLPDNEIKLIYRDVPQNDYYDKRYTISRFGMEVVIRDGMKGNRATTTYKTLKTEEAAKKLLEKNAAERIAAGCVLF